MKKVCFVMIDGVGDVSYSHLNNQTPLQYAKTPNMDYISENGINGLMDPVEPGLACGSDTAHMNIFGYNPREFYRGRGSFESMGAGIDMNKGDIAFKCNFATIKDGIVVSRRADRHFEEIGPIFCDLLNGIKLEKFPEYEITVKYATEHRCGIRIRGPNLTDLITDTDPLKDNLPLLKCKPKNDSKEAKITSEIVNELSKEFNKLLENHEINLKRIQNKKDPANIILFRGCGIRIEVDSFKQVHKMKGFMIAPTAIIKGFGKSIELDIKNSKGGTGDYKTDLFSKQETFIENIKDYDFGFLHIKAVDDCGHDKNLNLKIEFIEKIDKMIGKLLKELKEKTNDNFIILVTGDHTTPCVYGDHDNEPVPFTIMSSKNGEKDDVKKFSEIDASKGILGRFEGIHVFDIIKSMI